MRPLLTARRRDWPLELGLEPLNLAVFSPEESRAYLRRYLPEGRASDEELDALAARLGHLPLALRLAGRYLARLGRLTVDEYVAGMEDVFTDRSMVNWRAAYERALALFEQFLPADHPNIALLRRNLASLG